MPDTPLDTLREQGRLPEEVDHFDDVCPDVFEYIDDREEICAAAHDALNSLARMVVEGQVRCGECRDDGDCSIQDRVKRGPDWGCSIGKRKEPCPDCGGTGYIQLNAGGYDPETGDCDPPDTEPCEACCGTGKRKEGEPVSHDDEVFPDTEEGDR